MMDLNDARAAERAERIRLNDELRIWGRGGWFDISEGVRRRFRWDIPELLDAIASFKFDDDKHPYHEHDFGTLDFQGETITWRIHWYYDPPRSIFCEKPKRPEVTSRGMTVDLEKK